MKHINGTNITLHIDKFEKLCGQMVNCGFTPTEEEKIDWFLASIHERTYTATRYTHLGTIVVKLYTHQCFSRYPHFQVDDPNKDNKYLNLNNSTRFRGKGNKGSPQTFNKGSNGQFQRQEKGKGRGWSTNDRNRGYHGQKQNRIIQLARPSPKTQAKSKVKIIGRIMIKENHAVKKVKENDEAKGNKDSEMKERMNPK
jgi:hypothetical protein